MFERGELGVHRLLPLVKARYVEVNEIVRFDPEQLSFFNVNTEKDLQKARRLSGGDNADD
jgi:molybdopterin-guanine dinucleotide biosynthesis protein A